MVRGSLERSRGIEIMGRERIEAKGKRGTYRNIVNANNDSVRNNHNLSKRCY